MNSKLFTNLVTLLAMAILVSPTASGQAVGPIVLGQAEEGNPDCPSGGTTISIDGTQFTCIPAELGGGGENPLYCADPDREPVDALTNGVCIPENLLQVGDQFVANIALPNPTPVGAVPVLTTGNVHVTIYEGADYAVASSGTYNLVLQVDCGALVDVLGMIVTCAGGDDVETATIVKPFTASLTGTDVEVTEADLAFLLGEDLPVSAIHIFVETTSGPSKQSNFAAPTFLLSSDAQTVPAADVADATLWHPVIVAGSVDPTDNLPSTDLFEACAGTMDPTSAECAAALDSVPATVFEFVCSTNLLDGTELAMLCSDEPLPTDGAFEGDGLVAAFSFGEAGPVPVILADGPVTITADVQQLSGDEYGVYSGPITLFLQRDCGQLEPALAASMQCQDAFAYESVDGEAVDGAVSFTVSEAKITSLLNGLPATAIHVFVGINVGSEDAQYSHFNAVKELVVFADAAAADQLEETTFTPVLLSSGASIGGGEFGDGFLIDIDLCTTSYTMESNCEAWTEALADEAPLIISDDQALWVSFGVKRANQAGDYEDWNGPISLNFYLQSDCGPLAASPPQGLTCATDDKTEPGTAHGRTSGSIGPGQRIEVYFTADYLRNSGVFLADGPAAAAHIWAEVSTDEGFATSHYSLASRALFTAGEYAAADRVADTIWHPVVILDAGAGGVSPPPTGFTGDGFVASIGLPSDPVAGIAPAIVVGDDMVFTVDTTVMAEPFAGNVQLNIQVDCGELSEVVGTFVDCQDDTTFIASQTSSGNAGIYTFTFDAADLAEAFPEGSPISVVHVFASAAGGLDSHYNTLKELVVFADAAAADQLEEATFTPVILFAGAPDEPADTDPFEACADSMNPDSDECAAAVESVPTFVFEFLCSTNLLDDTMLAALCESEPEPGLTANAGGPYSGDANAAISIMGGAANGVEPYSCAWVGTGAQFENAEACETTVTYAADGDYTITLTVTDSAETPATATDEATVTVGEGSPPACDESGIPTTFPACLVPGDSAPGGDGFFAFWDASLEHSIENLQEGTPPYALHFQDDGSLRLAGQLFGPADYALETSGTASVYIELDCGALGNVPMLCESFGFDAEPVIQSVAVGPEGQFVVFFEEGDLAPLLETAADFPAPYLPIHVFVNHDSWTLDGVGQHSHFNAVAQALYGASDGAAVAAADLLEDTSFTPLLLPAGGDEPSVPEQVCLDEETCVPSDEMPTDFLVDCVLSLTADEIPDPDPCQSLFDLLGIIPDPICVVETEDPTCLGGGSGPTVTVAVAPAALNEGQSGTFTISRDGATTAAIDVTVKAGGEGTTLNLATNLEDYRVDGIAADGQRTVTIQAGASSVQVGFQALRDTVTEADETFTFYIVPDDAYEQGTPDRVEVTIRDVPVPMVSIAASPTSIDEGQSSTFTVTRSAQAGTLDTSAPLTVSLGSAGAAAPSDFSPAIPATLTIPAGQSSASFTVTNVAETVADGGKILTVSLVGSPDYAGTGSAGLELRDNDLPEVSVVATDAEATEASEANTGTFLVTRTGPTSSTLPVTIAIGGSAECGPAGDYQLQGASCGATGLTIPAGSSSVTITVSPNDDILREALEDVTLTVAAIEGVYTVPMGARVATVRLVDNDVPTVALRLIDGVASEAGPATARFAVDRSGADLTSPVTVTLAYSGTAASTGAGKDFDAATTVALAAGELTKTVTLTPVDDDAIEGAETAVATLVASGDYQLGSVTAVTITIADNDVAAADQDGDGVIDASDNCVSVANADQLNTDGDTQGDACDSDDDNDGLSDAAEAELGTDPLRADTDGDGRMDGDEVTAGTDPLDASSPSVKPVAVEFEPTGEGIRVSWVVPAGIGVDRFLVFRFSEPTLVGTVAAVEGQTAYDFVDAQYPGGNHSYAVQPMLPSQTGSEYNETLALKTAEQSVAVCEAFTTDSDNDGLCDREETMLGLDAENPDTDGDGRTDFAEVEAGSDPLQPNTVAPSEVKLARELPFWIGFALVVATLAALVIGIRQARPRPPEEPAFASDAGGPGTLQ